MSLGANARQLAAKTVAVEAANAEIKERIKQADTLRGPKRCPGRPPGPVKLPQAKAKNARKPAEKTYRNWWAPVTINHVLKAVHQSGLSRPVLDIRLCNMGASG